MAKHKKKVTEAKIFFVGLKDEDELVVEKKENDLCRIKSSTPSLKNDIRFKNIPDLKDQLLTALREAKELMVDGDKCYVSTRILCEPTWKLEAGSYKCSEIAERQIDWYCNKDVVKKIKRRYQPTPEKKYQLAVEIEIDGAEDTLSYRTFTDDNKDNAVIDVGHGYFLYPVKQRTLLFIVDPRKNISIMVHLTVYSGANPKYESFVREFHDNLKYKIILNPEGYSVEKMYARQNTVCKLSHETEILIQESNNTSYHTNLHFVDKKLVSKMNEKEWKEEDVTTMIEESLVQIDSLFTLLEFE